MDFAIGQSFSTNKEYQETYSIKSEKIPVAMVVASSGWVQNANFTNENDNNMSTESETNKMTAKGMLICRDNSHAFEDRTLVLDLPVKIGRSVARTRASPDNAIFDCKVLSRNHALLWYNAGKFYLQDTRSSNGTFVNNQRLSSTGLQSKATEVSSGDIVQFGVDVMESTRKVTHGCIIATLKLFLPDGKEAKASRTMYGTNPDGDVTLEDLYKLDQYIRAASRREQVLHSKLAYLQKLVENTRKAATQSWKALIDEDRLLTHVKTIESQLLAYSKNFTEDKIRTELIKLEEQKSQYQIAAKDALQKVHQEKLEVTQKLIALESRLNETEEECQSLHEISKHAQIELQELALKYSTAEMNLAQLEAKLVDKEQTSTEMVLSAAQEKQDLIEKVMRQTKIGNFLRQKLNENRSDSVKIHKEITSLRNYMQTLQDMNSKLSEDSKDGLNPVEAINAILDTLNEMIADSENIDDLENLAVSEDNHNKLQEIDSNEKIIINSKSDSFSQCNHTRDHILQTFIATLESLKGDDDLEAQHVVNCELSELRDWLIREPNEQVMEKLKELYYRIKNENSRMQEVNEELVILKEKFIVSNIEKSELTKQLKTFTTHCGDLLNASYSVPIQYFALVAVAFVWMLLEKMF
ncbi:sarcolemmal membrane-associated protein [Fopius arisanus]|uniref:Sarcolemmal membrane-associated protein n=1 Tax=Fopius arisanus TaxID=64838 RepID=A0A9R1U487_9HYME|nr:PREDICTED: sarcolemmal membrane-associated protein [Fopius arisanus]